MEPSQVAKWNSRHACNPWPRKIKLTGFHAPFFKLRPGKPENQVGKAILPYSHGTAASCNERQRVLPRDRDGQSRISEGVPVWQHFRAGRPGKFPKAFLQHRQNDGSTSIRIMLMDAALAGRLNFNGRWLSLAVVGGWQQD
jgi:hypothetical protein